MREDQRQLWRTTERLAQRSMSAAFALMALGTIALMLFGLYEEGRGSGRLWFAMVVVGIVMVAFWLALYLGGRWLDSKWPRREPRPAPKVTRWLVKRGIETVGVNLAVGAWLSLWAVLVARSPDADEWIAVVAVVLPGWFLLRALVQLWTAYEGAVAAEMRLKVKGDG